MHFPATEVNPDEQERDTGAELVGGRKEQEPGLAAAHDTGEQ